VARLGIGARLTVGAVLTAELAAAASGCTVKSDEHQPIQNRVTHAYTAQWIGAPGFHGYGCLAKTKVDPKPNEFSDYDPATLTVHPEDSTLTVTSALGEWATP
jgi:hypothetical protein